MRAIVVHQPGDSSVLKMEERPIPKATKDWSVMKIHAFGVHRYEVLTREGGSPSVHFPRVIGVEAVGEIYQPSETSKLTAGQKVVTMNGGLGREYDGSYEEYALVPDKYLYPVDFQGDWVSLAQYPETFATAYEGLKTLRLHQGQSLLLRGGTTIVGLAAIQLGKALGLKVTATTRQPERLPKLTEFGADDSVLDKDLKLQTDQTYDGILEFVGTPTLTDSMAHLKPMGTCSIVGMLDKEWVINHFDPFENLDQKYLTVDDSGNITPAEVQEMFKLIKDHHLTIPISKTFTLDQIAAAQDYTMTERPVGVVIVSND
ncbi:NADPH quinone reductase related Zn-dependent oxidoreductase [Lactobacillus selangorensis]|uniref:NADPH quinone reductase related Zn-dependent oxidoreductase n=1 Tax=Lactobacillus selangorensis TaxID=81857 RepID=A0A0R2FWW1_9LACO|nr:zinc-binding dehydrogenase [Lactobacillus selangorensis]KRN28788.1 NADPH quinone reductase related Zn-dependent oxidoreductase [Lactobacillus selangorensis]KRN32802.1 NADPH quinone reductase related Zn-dependent oxidoreductase [Lactobacillus selangorensis]